MKTVHERICEFYIDDLDGRPIDAFKDLMSEYEIVAGKRLDKLGISRDELVSIYFVDESGWDHTNVDIWIERPETDKEREKRLLKEKRTREKNKKVSEAAKVQRRKQYEKLKKEFEND